MITTESWLSLIPLSDKRVSAGSLVTHVHDTKARGIVIEISNSDPLDGNYHRCRVVWAIDVSEDNIFNWMQKSLQSIKFPHIPELKLPEFEFKFPKIYIPGKFTIGPIKLDAVKEDKKEDDQEGNTVDADTHR